MRALVVAMVCAAWLWVGSAQAEDLVQARAHFDAGVTLLQDPDGARYEEAYAEFKTAHELSGSPTVLGNLGLCAMKLERDGEAIDSFARYLAEVHDIDPVERAQVERDLQTLRTSVVTVTVTVPDAAGALVDTRTPVSGTSVTNVYPLAQRRTELRVRPGRHRFVLREAGVALASWELEAAPGSIASHRFVPSPPPPPERPAPPPEIDRPSPTGPILVIGLGASALVAGGILGIVALERTKELEEICPNDTDCPAAAEGRIERTRDYVHATDYLLLAGGVVAAAGLGWLIGNEVYASGDTVADAACSSHGCNATLRVRF